MRQGLEHDARWVMANEPGVWERGIRSGEVPTKGRGRVIREQGEFREGEVRYFAQGRT